MMAPDLSRRPIWWTYSNDRTTGSVDDTSSVRGRQKYTYSRKYHRHAEDVEPDDGPDPKPARGGEAPNPTNQEPARRRHSMKSQTPH